MIETLEKTGEIKTVKVEKDTWILELPEEICSREGFAKGTLASLTIKDGAIQGSFIRPTEAAKQSAERFINKYGDFMKEMDGIDG
ncbi:MAG: hypothetical protein LH472_05330 [Pyrinomonadaceae bacterium]|nr:hypothetical protein [Pyrinomonadaceae bacterium]